MKCSRLEGKSGAAHEIYKHLMNGVSHMIPFVVAGGVLIAVSFLWGIYSFDPNSDQYNPTAALLKQIGGYAMGLMVPVLAAYIAESIANRPGSSQVLLRASLQQEQAPDSSAVFSEASLRATSANTSYIPYLVCPRNLKV